MASEHYPPFVNDFNMRLGIVQIIDISAISLIAVTCLLAYIARNLWRRPRRIRPIAILFLGILVFDVLRAIASLLSARWASLGMVIEDDYCVAQGAMKNLASVGIALFTLALTWATLFKLVFESEDFSAQRAAIWITTGLVSLILLFLCLIIVIPLKLYGRHYYGNTGIWCWISDDFPVERQSLEYRWFWATSVSTVIVHLATLAHAYGYLIGGCTSVGLWLAFRRPSGRRVLRFIAFERQARGNSDNRRTTGIQLWTQDRAEERIIYGAIVLDSVVGLVEWEEVNEMGDKDEPSVAVTKSREERARRMRREARMLLWFPVTYVVVILPQSVVRFRQFAGHHTSTAATVISSCIFALSGLFNTLLYMTGRFQLDLGPDPHRNVEDSR